MDLSLGKHITAMRGMSRLESWQLLLTPSPNNPLSITSIFLALTLASCALQSFILKTIK
jgi:hypothetical protein